MMSNEIEAVLSLRAGQMMQRGPSHERASNGGWVSATIQFMLGQDMPNNDEKFAGNGGDGFLLAQAFGKHLKSRAPVRREANGNPGGGNQGSAQFSTTLLTDFTCLAGVAGGTHPCSQTSIANQVGWRWKAVNIANRSQDGYASV